MTRPNVLLICADHWPGPLLGHARILMLTAAYDRCGHHQVDNCYGSDLRWVRDGELVGEPDKPFAPAPDRGLRGQRGWRQPHPPPSRAPTILVH